MTDRTTASFEATARMYLCRFGSGTWVEREAPVLAKLLRETFEDGRHSALDSQDPVE